MIPEVVAVGEPDLAYPERWSVVRWIDGKSPDAPTAADGVAGELARDLAAVAGALSELPLPLGGTSPTAADGPAWIWTSMRAYVSGRRP